MHANKILYFLVVIMKKKNALFNNIKLNYNRITYNRTNYNGIISNSKNIITMKTTDLQCIHVLNLRN